MTAPDPTHRAPREPEELDSRKAAILEAIVTEYIGTAQPVGSSHVAKASGVSVSSATIRSEMVALERDGYLVQPHTSAGRIPTDKGYRFFVDHLSAPGSLGPAQRQRVSTFFTEAQGGIEDMLERTSSLLSDLTSYAAVVVGPSHEQATVRSVQVVGLSAVRATVVVVLSDGAVESRTIEISETVTVEDLAAATSALDAAWNGTALHDLSAVKATGDVVVDGVCARAAEVIAGAGRMADHEPVFVGGPSRLAGSFDAIETVRGVLSILEQELVVVSLLRDVLESGLSVAIGSEHGFEPLASCAVVVAPVHLEGQQAGAVGLLGPTRMNYPAAMAAAEVVGRHLSRHLGEDHFDPEGTSDAT
jgi:heat-inducible transcriptional repressor